MKSCPNHARRSVMLAGVALFCTVGCPGPGDSPSERGASFDEAATAPGAESATIEVTSPAFDAGGPIPAKYTEDGEDVSPPLAWSGVPEGTEELALICDDPDAPSPKRAAANPWVHWVLYKIPADARELPEGIPKTARVDDPPGALQGKNSWPTIGYRGPAPPPGSGTHRYFFKLYALDAELTIEPEMDKTTLQSEMEGHVIGEGSLFGTYER